MGRVLGIVVLVLVVFWIIDSPTTASATVSNIFVILAGFAESLVEFVRSLF